MKRLFGVIAAGLAVVMLSMTPVMAASSCTTRVGGTLPGGPGHPGSVYAGTWTCGSVVGFCGNFALHGPDQSGDTKVIGKIPGMSQAKSDLFAQINGMYRLTRDKGTAMAAAYAEWKLVGGSAFAKYNRWAVKTNQFPSVRARAASMIAEAKRLVGLKMSVKLKPSDVGVTTTGKVLVTSKAGKPLRGVKVKLNAVNAKLNRKAGTSNGNGVVDFKLTPMSLKTVEVTATTSVIRVRHILSTTPSVGQQHIFSVPLKDKKVARASFKSSVNGPTISSECDTECRGLAHMKAEACAKRVPLHYVGLVDGKPMYELTVKAGMCRSVKFDLADGSLLTAKACTWGAGSCTSDYVSLPGKFEVKCPPAPEVYFSAQCDCAGLKGYTVLVDVPASPRVYKARVSVNGTQFGELTTLINGNNNKLPLAGVQSGDKITIQVTVFHQTTGKQLADWTFSDEAPTAGKVTVTFKR